MANFLSLTCKIFFIVSIFCSCAVESRKHTLVVKDDPRSLIILSRFGFLEKGYLSVDLTNILIKGEPKDPILLNDKFGFSLAKTSSNGVNSFVDDDDKCIFTPPKEADKDPSSVVLFKFDLKKKSLSVSRRGTEFSNLTILYMEEKSYTEKTGVRVRRSQDVLSDSYLMASRRRRRRALVTVSPPATQTHQPPASDGTLSVYTITTKKPSLASGTQDTEGILRFLVMDSINITLDGTGGGYSVHFVVEIGKNEEGLYNLNFHNCANLDKEGSYLVNFTANIVENNNGNYLSAGDMPLPTARFVLTAVYLAMAALWFYTLHYATEGVFKIHYLMFVLVIVKALAVLFHGLNSYFIQRKGHHEEALAVIYYITFLMRGILLFVTIVLIGAGWAFVKYILSERDKKIFIIVIPLQILANVAQIIIDETEEGESQYMIWGQVLILVDLLCCGAILFPIVWSIRHLQEASQIDGKAAISLNKLKIFRHFYILIVCYIYFTRIIVFLLSITVPFQYSWIYEVFKEVATVVFFLITGYKFRPASNNPYLQLSVTDDEEEEPGDQEEVVFKSGDYETLKMVNQRPRSDSQDGIKQRENSHEYD